MPNYMDNFNVDEWDVSSEFIPPNRGLSRKQREAVTAAIEKSKFKEASDLQVESAKAGAWEGYRPKPAPNALDPNTSVNWPDVMSSQGREAYRMGGQSRMQSLQGISNVARQKSESDEATAEVNRLNTLTTQAKTQMEVLISSDNYTNKSMDELNAKVNRYEKTGQSYPSDVLDFEIKQINRVRELAKLDPINVRDLKNLNEFKTKMGVRDSEMVVKNYNELLKPDTTPDRKAELIGELSSQVPEIRKRNADPKMFMEIDEALKQQTAELAKMATPEKPLRSLKTIYGPNGQTREVQVGDNFTPPAGWSLKTPFKPEDNTYKNMLMDEKKQQKYQEAKTNLDKWFTDAVTKAGGELAPTPEGGFELVKEFGGGGPKGQDPKINSIKTVYDKALKGIEKTYVDERKQAAEAIKARPELAEKIKAMYKQETGQDYE
jgi:hypothetical protein